MTAFSPSDLPTSVDTLEKLAAWVGLALHVINPEVTSIEGAGTPGLAAQFGTFFVQEINAPKAILRQSIDLQTDYLYGSAKFWTYAKEISTSSLPTEFTQDSQAA